MTFRNICTLHELEQDLCRMETKEEKKASFDEFYLGPLQKQLLVYEYFKFPLESPIPQINTVDVFKYLRNFTRKWNNKRVKEAPNDGRLSLEDFFEYLMEKRGFDNPFESGVRFGSFPLAIQVC